MSRNAEFEESLQKMRRRVYQMIGERSRKFGEELSKRLCEVFADRARQRLIKYATPKDETSFMQVEALAKTIVAKKSSTGLGYEVSIPVDGEGLLLFLEYGTGTVGENNRHPEAKSVGWEYNSKKDAFRTKTGGWFFKRYPTRGDETAIAYLDEEDITPVHSYRVYESTRGRVRGYVTKKGKKVKSYTRHRSKTQTRIVPRDNSSIVWSKGLMPVRFIYDTKQELRKILDLFRSYKRKAITPEEVFNKIYELERSTL